MLHSSRYHVISNFLRFPYTHPAGCCRGPADDSRQCWSAIQPAILIQTRMWQSFQRTLFIRRFTKVRNNFRNPCFSRFRLQKYYIKVQPFCAVKFFIIYIYLFFCKDTNYFLIVVYLMIFNLYSSKHPDLLLTSYMSSSLHPSTSCT